MRIFHNKASTPYENRMFLETIEPGCREICEELGIIHSCLINSAKVKNDETIPIDVDALFFTPNQMIIVEMKNYQKVNMLDQESFLKEPWKVTKGEASNKGNTFRSEHNQNPYQQTNNIKDRILKCVEGINPVDVQRIVVVPNDYKIMGEIPSNIYDFSVVNERDFKQAFFQHVNVISHGTVIDADALVKRSVEDRTPQITSRPTSKLKDCLRAKIFEKSGRNVNSSRLDTIIKLLTQDPGVEKASAISALYQEIFPGGETPKSKSFRNGLRTALRDVAQKYNKELKTVKNEMSFGD